MVLGTALDLAMYLIAGPWLDVMGDFSGSPLSLAGKSLLYVELAYFVSKLSTFSFLLVARNSFA